MSVRAHIAIKYEVDFDELCYSADDVVRLIRKIQTDYCEDVVAWVDEHETDFELSRYELRNLIASGKTADDTEVDVFIGCLLENCDPANDYIKIQLY